MQFISKYKVSVSVVTAGRLVLFYTINLWHSNRLRTGRLFTLPSNTAYSLGPLRVLESLRSFWNIFGLWVGTLLESIRQEVSTSKDRRSTTKTAYIHNCSHTCKYICAYSHKHIYTRILNIHTHIYTYICIWGAAIANITVFKLHFGSAIGY
jgi:hypothetical protein